MGDIETSYIVVLNRYKTRLHIKSPIQLTFRTTENIKDADDATLIQMGTFLADISDKAKGQLDKVGLSMHGIHCHFFV